MFMAGGRDGSSPTQTETETSNAVMNSAPGRRSLPFVCGFAVVGRLFVVSVEILWIEEHHPLGDHVQG